MTYRVFFDVDGQLGDMFDDIGELVGEMSCL